MEFFQIPVGQYEPYVTALRREFHENPELSGREKETSRRLIRELDRIGLPHRPAGGYGVIAELESGRPGRTILLRADMDALPIEESPCNAGRERPVVSRVPGVSHMCGHDAHMAMLLGAARALAEHRGRLSGRILFCFEPGEENFTGIRAMIEALAGEKVDAVWGIHVMPGLPSGVLGIRGGPVMSGIIGFHVTLTGKGGHGSRPDRAIDPILCAAQLVVALHSIRPEEISPYRTAVLSIGSIRAGEADNILPETAEVKGTIRYFDREVGETMRRSLLRVMHGVAATYRCRASVGYHGCGIPVVNDPRLAGLFAASAERALGPGGVVTAEPRMGSDSMAEYLSRYPGVYALLGVDNPAVGSGADNHNPHFDIDEACLIRGVAATVQVAADFLRG